MSVTSHSPEGIERCIGFIDARVDEPPFWEENTEPEFELQIRFLVDRKALYRLVGLLRGGIKDRVNSDFLEGQEPEPSLAPGEAAYLAWQSERENKFRMRADLVQLFKAARITAGDALPMLHRLLELARHEMPFDGHFLKGRYVDDEADVPLFPQVAHPDAPHWSVESQVTLPEAIDYENPPDWDEMLELERESYGEADEEGREEMRQLVLRRDGDLSTLGESD